ncbi:MAG: M4 family metallopeptidase, partial [Chloroflexi bacterium]|nr:M4 family metallopeptidase [Chloroflexota bacterium]
MREEGEPWDPQCDVEANWAHEVAGDVYDFYSSLFERDSYDNQGSRITSIVRYRKDVSTRLPNAFWDSEERWIVYGEEFAKADDIAAHELTHGVTQSEANLYYYMQSGAMNESLSDVLGEITDQMYTRSWQNDGDDQRWVLGEDLPLIYRMWPSDLRRDMSDPPRFGQPDKMTSALYACGPADRGGVHTNSGIGNKAASLLADGGDFNNIHVATLGNTKTAKVFYEAQINHLTSGSDYQDLYYALWNAATALVRRGEFGLSDRQQVLNAANAVEMYKQPANCSTVEVEASCPSGVRSDLFFDDFEEQDDCADWLQTATLAHEPWGCHAEGYVASGTRSLYGPNLSYPAVNRIEMSFDVALPAGGSAFLHFKHAFNFDHTPEQTFDGGVVEYSTDGGATWHDAGALMSSGLRYNGTIGNATGNPLAGRQAFLGASNGYASSLLSLQSLGGRNVRFRFVIGTDSENHCASDPRNETDSWACSIGWVIDDVRIFTCGTTAVTPTYTSTPIPTSTPLPPPQEGVQIVSIYPFGQIFQPGATFSPRVRLRVTGFTLSQARGDHINNIDGNAYGAWPVVGVIGENVTEYEFP